VKGWNHIYARNLARPEVDGQAASVFICGDDDAAKETVVQLARDAGFDPVDVGPLATTRHLD
jgi:8-hydroxy-5-deazaflavin:NADPH oxidoreductase